MHHFLLIFTKISNMSFLSILWSSPFSWRIKLILVLVTSSINKRDNLEWWTITIWFDKMVLLISIRGLRTRSIHQFKILKWRLRSSSIFHPYWTLRVQSLLLHLLPEISLQRGNRCITMLDEIEVYIHIDWNRDLVPKTLI